MGEIHYYLVKETCYFGFILSFSQTHFKLTQYKQLVEQEKNFMDIIYVSQSACQDELECLFTVAFCFLLIVMKALYVYRTENNILFHGQHFFYSQ